jgi:hypothetical protein
MALEIKVLDYGDVEQLESSFLVLGRDCGRTRRVLVLGMLILGGTWPILVDTGYRSNQIMETLGVRGLQAAKSWHHISAAYSLPFTISASRSTGPATALPIKQILPKLPDRL